jgi:carbonic anhydrase
VIRQVRNVASDVFVQEAWARGQDLRVHGWVYSLANGLVTDLDVTIERLGYQRKLAPHPQVKTEVNRLD